MPIGTGIIYNVGDLILGTVSGSGTAFLETKIAAATSSIVYFDSNARINSASLNSITVGTASYVSGSTSIITNLTASNISASGTSSFGYVGIGTTLPSAKLDVVGSAAISSTLTVTGTTALNGAVNLSTAGTPTVTLGAASSYGVLLASGTNAASIYLNGASRTGFEAKLQFGAAEHQWFNGSLSSQIMTLNTTGLGIGTSNPSTQLDIRSTAFTPSSTLGALMVEDKSTWSQAIQFYLNNAGTYNSSRPSGAIGAANNNVIWITGGSFISNNPAGLLGFTATGADASAYVAGAGYHKWYTNSGLTAGNTFTATERYNIDSTGVSTWSVAGTTSMTLKSTGLGIGTTTPNNKLHVYNSAGSSTTASNAIAVFEESGNAGIQVCVPDASEAGLFFSRNGAAYYSAIARNGTDLTLKNNSTTAVTINSSGNVGIGTTSPAYKLDVSGSMRVFNNPTTNNWGITLENTNVNGWGVSQYFRLYGYNSTPAASFDVLQINASYPGFGQVDFLVKSQAQSTAATVMSLLGNGNVGIGTTAPGALLEISSSTAASLLNVKGTGGNGLLFVSGSGEVGIGTTSLTDGARLTILGETRIASSAAYFTHLNYLNGGNNIISSANGGSTVFRGSSNNITAMTILGSGLVGIGTSSPAVKLDVVGTTETSIRVADTGGSSLELYQQVTDSYLLTTNALRIYTSGSARMSILNNGNVGIGRTSPQQKLHIAGTNARLAISNDSDNNWAEIGNDGSSGQNTLEFFTGTSVTPAMSITNDNNVGIGTSSPVAALDVSRLEYPSLGGVLANFSAGTTDPTTEKYVILRQTYTGTAFDSPMLVFRANANSANSGSFGIVRTTSNGSIVFSNVNATSGTVTAVSEKMRINSDGNVGIGTTTTTSGLLSLHGTYPQLNINNPSTGSGVVIQLRDNGRAAGAIGHFTSTNYLQFSTAGQTPQITLMDTGNVGIGTSNPTQLLELKKTTGSVITILNYNDSVKFNINASSTGAGYVGMITNHPLIFVVNDAEKVRIDTAGNVGIGVSAPNTKLTVWTPSTTGLQTALRLNNPFGFDNVNTGTKIVFSQDRTAAEDIPMGEMGVGQEYGATSQAGYMFFSTQLNTSMGEKMRITSDGYVGIGTTSPTSKLHVVETNATGSRIQLGTNSANSLMSATGVNDFIILTAPFGPTPASTNNNGAKWGIKLNGSIDSPNTKGKAACIYAVSEEPGAGYNRRVGLALHTSPFDLDSVERLRISNDGNVGIGTTSPAYKLDVAGSVYGSNYFSVLTAATYGPSDNSAAMQVFGSTGSGGLTNTIKFLTGGSERVRIDDNGNIGLGTSSPSAKLQIGTQTYATAPDATYFVAGNDSFSGPGPVGAISGYPTTANKNQVTASLFDVVGGWEVVNGSHALLRASAYNVIDSTPAFVVLNNGNVGIGTSSPAAKLHVTSSASTLAAIFQGNVGVGNQSGYYYGLCSLTKPTSGLNLNIIYGSLSSGYGEILMSNYNDNTGGTGYASYIRSYSNPANDYASILTFGTSPASSGGPVERMRIAATGNVGIGTSNAVAKLQVSGSVTIGGYDAVYSGTNVSSLNITAISYPVLAFYYGTTLAGTVGGYSDHVSIYAPASKYISFEPGDSEKMRITADGNVGIGTTSPTAKLQINNASDSRLIVYETGTSPYTATLELSSQVLGTYGATVQYTSDTEKLTIQNYGRSSASSTQGGILFRTKLNNTTATDVMAINGFSGNVGIGTTVPVAKLEISGSSNSALLNIKSPISGAILFVSGSGAVGINTSTVGAYTLQVNGSFAATTKSFIIDHPTKAGKKLIYGSLESPYHGIRLTGRDTLKEGKCKVELPDYIYKLILHDSVNIQLTGIKCNKTLYVDEINIPENYFTIAYDNAIFESYKDYDFFWDFTGIRTDVPELITEL